MLLCCGFIWQNEGYSKNGAELIAKVKPAEVMRNAWHKNQHDWAKSELGAALKWARGSSTRYNGGCLFCKEPLAKRLSFNN
jgi:hypothetical protein